MYDVVRHRHNWLMKLVINRQVARHLPDMRGVVYDLGCGTRPFESDILRHADRYVGVDWENSLHATRPDVVADLNEPLAVDDGVADTVVAFEVLEHVREPAALLSEAFRITHAGGRLMVSVPFQWWVHEAPWDYYRYTRYGLEHLLRKAGYTDVHVAATSGFWTTWVLKLNYQTAKLIRGPFWLRRPLRLVLGVFWWVDQVVADGLDRLRADENETVGYFAVARKP